jgi:hypothetical protein
MTSIDFRYKEGDTAPALRYRVTDVNGDAVDLHTGTLAASSATLKIRTPAASAVSALLTIEGAASASYVHYDTIADFTASAGYYPFETEVRWSDGTLTTYPESGYKVVRVDPDLG